MAPSKPALVALGAAALVHGVGLVGTWLSYSPLKPVLECVEPLPDGSTLARFSYFNATDGPISLPVGEDNRFFPGEADRGQPRVFRPGRVGADDKHTIRVLIRPREVLTWHLDGREEVAWRFSKRCEGLRAQRAFPEPKPVEKIEVKPPPKPAPPEPKPAPPEPKPAPPPPKAEPRPDPPSKPKPRPKRRRRGQPKRKPKPKAAPKPEAEAPKPAEPAPLVLENVNLTGTVAVQKGDQDLYGDPTVAATERNTRVDDGGSPDGVEGGTGAGPAAPPKPPKITSPRVRKAVQGRYPDDAPRLGRVVKVRLSLLVGKDGRVQKVRVVKGAGKVFDDAARRVARRLLFYPGRRDGVPIALSVPWTVEFYPDE